MLALKLHGSSCSHSRHHHIVDEQIDLAAMFSGNRDGFLDVFRFDHLVAAGFQKFAGNFTNGPASSSVRSTVSVPAGISAEGFGRADMHFRLVYTRKINL